MFGHCRGYFSNISPVRSEQTERIYPNLEADFSVGTLGRAAAVWLLLSHHCCWFNAQRIIESVKLESIHLSCFLPSFNWLCIPWEMEKLGWMVGVWEELEEAVGVSSWVGTVLPCTVTCSSLPGHEICTQQQGAADNWAETVLVCSEVWLL